MTRYKYSASSTVAPAIFAIHLMNVAQFLNGTWVTLSPLTVISPFTKIKRH